MQEQLTGTTIWVPETGPEIGTESGPHGAVTHSAWPHRLPTFQANIWALKVGLGKVMVRLLSFDTFHQSWSIISSRHNGNWVHDCCNGPSRVLDCTQLFFITNWLTNIETHEPALLVCCCPVANATYVLLYCWLQCSTNEGIILVGLVLHTSDSWSMHYQTLHTILFICLDPKCTTLRGTTFSLIKLLYITFDCNHHDKHAPCIIQCQSDKWCVRCIYWRTLQNPQQNKVNHSPSNLKKFVMQMQQHVWLIVVNKCSMRSFAHALALYGLNNYVVTHTCWSRCKTCSNDHHQISKETMHTSFQITPTQELPEATVFFMEFNCQQHGVL